MTEESGGLRRPDAPISPLGIAVIAATLVLDQAAKVAALQFLPIGRPVDILPILAFFRVNNTGIAFSLFADLGGGALTIVTLAITIGVLGIWWRATDGGRLAAIGYALIVGGALGNLIDRAREGHVVDFLLLHFGERTLFVFNLADAALTAGPALLLLVYLFPAWAKERS
jgi:signal peptidase II